MQISSEIVINNKRTRSFLQALCPSSHPTNSIRAMKEETFLSRQAGNKTAYHQTWSQSETRTKPNQEANQLGPNHQHC